MHLRKIGTKKKFQAFEGKIIKNMFCRDLKNVKIVDGIFSRRT